MPRRALLAAAALHLLATGARADGEEATWTPTAADRAAAPPVHRESPPPPAPRARLARPIRSFNPIGAAPREVRGVLSDRILFCAAGHGYTYNLTTGVWYTQRGDALSGACDVVEDLGNADQLFFLAERALNAGAMVVPFRPIGFQDHEIVIDNDDAAASFTPAGAWVSGSGVRYFGGAADAVPYRIASATRGGATAAAVFDASSQIPAAGTYPVYVWASSGPDRIHQEFIISHEGGQTARRVNLRMAGGFWFYLGTYGFKPGGPASVTITNAQDAADTGTLVVADAVRFGNGMGTIDRGGGVSGRTRQEENSKYWVMAGIGQGVTAALTYGESGNDQNDNVGTPPRTAALMNATEADWKDCGFREQRVFVSFHSNASGGASRGACGLFSSYVASPTVPNEFCTTHQVAYATLLGRRVNEDLYTLTRDPANKFELSWGPLGQPGRPDSDHLFGSGRANINSYGEINTGPTQNEFDATIMEVAMHDETNDCKLLRDPKIRDAVARATLKAIIQYFATFGGGEFAYPPEPPLDPALTSSPDGTLLLRWSASPSGGPLGDAPTGYIVYSSADGLGWGDARVVPGGAEARSIDVTARVPAGSARFFRVAATNAAGESFPAATVGARRNTPARARTLIVNGFDRMDRGLNPRQTLALNGSSAINTFDRIDLKRSNTFNFVPTLGAALDAAGAEFDSCERAHVARGEVSLADYRNVFWILGEQDAANETFSSAEQAAISAFLDARGNLFVSGTDLARDLDSLGSASDKAFLNAGLAVVFSADDANSYSVSGEPGSLFAGLSFSFDDGTQGAYNAEAPDAFLAGTGGVVGMKYVGGTTGNAAIVYDGTPAGRGKVVALGFPLETITSESARNAVILNSYVFFNPQSGSAGWSLY